MIDNVTDVKVTGCIFPFGTTTSKKRAVELLEIIIDHCSDLPDEKVSQLASTAKFLLDFEDELETKNEVTNE